MGRALGIGVVAFAAGLAVGLLVGRRNGSTSGDDDTSGGTPPAEASQRREPPKRARAPANPELETAIPARAPAPTPVPISADVREIPLEGAPTGWTDVDVEVVDAEGHAVKQASVYALPVGAPGTNAWGGVPSATPDGEGRCRLRVPSPGVFDVAASFGGAVGRAEDVAVPRAHPVRVVLPPHADVVFEPASGANFPRPVYVRLERTARGTEHTFAARGEQGDLGFGPYGPRTVVRAGTSRRLALPTGIEFRAASDEPYVFDPPTFSAPATVRVRPTDGQSPRELAVRLKLETPDQRWERQRRFTWTFTFDGADRLEMSCWRGATETVKRLVRAPRGKLAWSGPRIEPGEAAWDLDAAPTLDVRVVAKDPIPDAARGVRLYVDLAPGEASDPEGMVGLLYESDDVPGYFSTGQIRVREEIALDLPGEWFAVSVGQGFGDRSHRLVAGPARIRRGERTVLTPRRGGFLVLASGELPTDLAGMIEVARADGAPFGIRDAPEGMAGVRWSVRATAPAGAVLGPFEPGPVVLDIFVGGVRFGRYEATIREDAYIAFAPRPLR